VLGVTGCISVAGNVSTIDCPRAGQQRITITGRNFGQSGAVALVGSSLCTNVQQPLAQNPHRVLMCTIPAAITRFSIIDLPILVIQSGGLSTGLVSVSYRQCDVRFAFLPTLYPFMFYRVSLFVGLMYMYRVVNSWVITPMI
jgi:hypothetical protein